jgi:hypothetical protein
MVPAYRAVDDRAGMFFELDYYANPARGAVPAWKNEMAELSWINWLAQDGITPASDVSTPSLLAHGNDCVLPDDARAVHSRLRARRSCSGKAGLRPISMIHANRCSAPPMRRPTGSSARLEAEGGGESGKLRTMAHKLVSRSILQFVYPAGRHRQARSELPRRPARDALRDPGWRLAIGRHIATSRVVTRLSIVVEADAVNADQAVIIRHDRERDRASVLRANAMDFGVVPPSRIS